jgi:hypothetical protein
MSTQVIKVKTMWRGVTSATRLLDDEVLEQSCLMAVQAILSTIEAIDSLENQSMSTTNNNNKQQS